MKNKFKPAISALAALAAAVVLPSCSSQEENKIEPLFQPTLESMEAHFQAPVIRWLQPATNGTKNSKIF